MVFIINPTIWVKLHWQYLGQFPIAAQVRQISSNLMVNYLTTAAEPFYHRGFNDFCLCSEHVHSSCESMNNDFHRDLPCIPVLSKGWENSDKLGDIQISTLRVITVIRIIASLVKGIILRVPIRSYTSHLNSGLGDHLAHNGKQDFPLKEQCQAAFSK